MINNIYMLKTHKFANWQQQELLHEIVQVKLMIKHSIDISNCFCSCLEDKYESEMLKSPTD